MAVLHPLKVIISNFPEDRTEQLQAANHPQDESMGVRSLALTREIYIDREDFREEAPSKFKRLVTGGEVRLRNAYVIRCDEVIKGADGEIVELHCSYDPDTLVNNPEGRKVRGVIHWVSARHGIQAEVRLYDRLFSQPDPGKADEEGRSYTDYLNPESLRTLTHCWLEASLDEAQPGQQFQFEREGYFCADPDHSRDRPIFNRAVTLRDSWAKLEKQKG
jgi:glutaminyl-tRNA synthetase